jgi:uncharacterized protein
MTKKYSELRAQIPPQAQARAAARAGAILAAGGGDNDARLIPTDPMTAATPPAAEPPDPETRDDDPADATLDLLEEALEAIVQRHPDDTPQWEYCEGFMTALLCTRRAINSDEWLPWLFFGRDAAELFATESEHTRFLMAWMEREAQLRDALKAGLDAPDDESPFSPAVIDWRGLIASLPEDARAEALKGQDGPPPALGRQWAAGFMAAVLAWADDWSPPRDKDMAADMKDALDLVFALTDDDTSPPALNLYDPDAPPSVSKARSQAVADAMEAVHILYDIAQLRGPRLPPHRNPDKTGRNDPCPCGSGKKYKKCCGA